MPTRRERVLFTLARRCSGRARSTRTCGRSGAPAGPAAVISGACATPPSARHPRSLDRGLPRRPGSPASTTPATGRTRNSPSVIGGCAQSVVGLRLSPGASDSSVAPASFDLSLSPYCTHRTLYSFSPSSSRAPSGRRKRMRLVHQSGRLGLRVREASRRGMDEALLTSGTPFRSGSGANVWYPGRSARRRRAC